MTGKIRLKLHDETGRRLLDYSIEYVSTGGARAAYKAIIEFLAEHTPAKKITEHPTKWGGDHCNPQY